MLFATKNGAVTVPPIAPTDLAGPQSLAGKLFFLQMTQNDIRNLRKLESLFDEHAAAITDRHYDMLAQVDELRALVERHSTFERLKVTFVQYLKSIPRVELDDKYVEIRLRIGQAHSRVGLGPEWVIGSFTRIYEFMMQAIVKAFSKSEAAEILLSLNRILTLDCQIMIESYSHAHEFKFIETNSQIVEELIQIDKVQPLLDALEVTVAEAANVSAAAEELNASIQEIATQAVHVSDESEELMNSASHGRKVIMDSLEGFLQTAEMFKATKQQFDALFEEIRDISGVVELIREVADQTQLLALNAAIEAARAGEEGRGFAVVASEVRKLSEQTKESVQQIAEKIQMVSDTAVAVSRHAEEMAGQMEGRVEQAEEAVSTLENILNQVKVVGEATGNISAIVEEQSAATHEITVRIQEIMTQTEQIHKHAIETGRNIYDVSVKVNDLRLQSLNHVSRFGHQETMRVVKTDHLLWRWWIYNSLLGYHQINAQTAGDHANCRLGQWYNRLRETNIAELPSYRALEEPHQRFHQLAKEAVLLTEGGNRLEARSVLEKIQHASGDIIRLLDALQNEMAS